MALMANYKSMYILVGEPDSRDHLWELYTDEMTGLILKRILNIYGMVTSSRF
jgi:hypothetical protein